MDAALFFVVFGVCLAVQELGAPGGWSRNAPKHPGEEGMSRRKLRIIHRVWYAGIAAFIVAWWFGSDFAGEMLLVVSSSPRWRRR